MYDSIRPNAARSIQFVRTARDDARSVDLRAMNWTSDGLHLGSHRVNKGMYLAAHLQDGSCVVGQFQAILHELPRVRGFGTMILHLFELQRDADRACDIEPAVLQQSSVFVDLSDVLELHRVLVVRHEWLDDDDSARPRWSHLRKGPPICCHLDQQS